MKRKAFFAALVMIIALSPAAFAHVPNVLNTSGDEYSERIDGDEVEASNAYYATFEFSGDVDYYYFRLSSSDVTDTSQTMTDVFDVTHNLIVTDENGVTGRKLHLGTLVPACGVYADLRPTVAVVGPLQTNLPAYDGSVPLPADVEIDDDEGIFILENPVQGPVWYEHFTYKSYFDGPKDQIVVDKDGKYKIYVWEPSGLTGDYVLEVGDIEVFGLFEILQSIQWVCHIALDGEIMNETCEDQLEALDGPNPTCSQVMQDMIDQFAN